MQLIGINGKRSSFLTITFSNSEIWLSFFNNKFTDELYGVDEEDIRTGSCDAFGNLNIPMMEYLDRQMKNNWLLGSSGNVTDANVYS